MPISPTQPIQPTFGYDYVELNDDDMAAVLSQLNTRGAQGWRLDWIVQAGGFSRIFLIQESLPLEQSGPIPVYLGGAPGVTLIHLAAAGSTLLKTGSGMIRSMDINTTSASSTLTIYDGTSAAGTVMAVIDCSKSAVNVGTVGWPFKTGCFLVLTGSPDITIVFV